MEDVTRNYHEVRLQFDSFFHYLPESGVEVCATYIYIVLGASQMQISCVDKTERFDGACLLSSSPINSSTSVDTITFLNIRVGRT